MDRVLVVVRAAADVLSVFRRSLIALAISVALVGGVAVAASPGLIGVGHPSNTSSGSPSITLAPNSPTIPNAPADQPTLDTSPTAPPTNPPVTTASGVTPSTVPDTVSFMATGMNGQPMRIDPCADVAVLYRSDGEPYDALQDVAAATSMVAYAIGHPINVFTDNTADAKVLITVEWVPTPNDLADVDPAGLGEGGPTFDDRWIVSGQVRLVAQPATPRPGGMGTGEFGVVILHELIHAVGVGHSTDARDVMFPSTTDTSTPVLGPGDIAALGAVGGACPA